METEMASRCSVSKSPVNSEAFALLSQGAADRSRVGGSVHSFYRYPARFSPSFATAAIEAFSSPGDLVLDPYMGGGTAIVEAIRNGRQAFGNDLNSLAVFIARVKTTPLTEWEESAIHDWAEKGIENLRYDAAPIPASPFYDRRLRNMQLPRARFIKKITAIALSTIDGLTLPAQAFIRCAILRTAQGALDGKMTHTPLWQFRRQLKEHIFDMLSTSKSFWTDLKQNIDVVAPTCVLCQGDAGTLHSNPFFTNSAKKVSLVVTSPPYPGLHVLYHRWQVDGRKESPAPYWISACMDGEGASFYNFGDRHEENLNSYFDSSLKTLKSIRLVMKEGATIIQMIAFSDAPSQLPRYLENMNNSGFSELGHGTAETSEKGSRIWRTVPSRKWHAALKGETGGSREVVLIHRAV